MPNLTLVLAGRYNLEDRDFTVDYRNAPGGTLQAGSLSDSAFLPQIGLNYHPAADILLYAKISEGYQTPGQGGAGIRYERGLSSNVCLRANANYTFESDYPFQTSVEPATAIPSWDRIDGRIGLQFDHFEVYAFGRNLADERHPTSAFRLSPTIAFVAINDPRIYGFGFKYTY